MSKMGLHGPFEHLQHKLWQKEGSRLKLAVWLPTTKSWELTWPRCVQVECDTPLESSQGEIQVCFRPHPIEILDKELWPCKVSKVQTGIVLGLLLGSFKTKSHLDVGAAEIRKEYYMGEGGGFTLVRTVVSLVRPKLPVACPSTKNAPESDLTNLLVGLMQVRVSN